MVKLEADYKREMVKAIKKAGGYGRRVEDQFAVGTLDLLLAMPGTELVSCEVKRIVKGQQFALSPRQYEEMRRASDGGARIMSVGVRITDSRCFAYGLPKNRDGLIRVSDCLAQMDGESFPEFFNRYIGEQYGRPVSEITEPVNSSDSGTHSVDGAGEPARRSGGQLRSDREIVDGILALGDEAPDAGR